jgi:hypothetical protein
MMRLLVAVLLLVSFDASAAVRRLATDCTVPVSVPTEAAPFDLDACTLVGGDDITSLLKDIQVKWPDGFYVRAPSKSLTLISDYIAWPSATKVYVFMEDQDPVNKLTIQHKSDPADFWRMWKFENFATVKLGGPNLSLTFRGNHPGLANCDVQYPLALAEGIPDVAARICDINRGLIEFRMSDGTQATLADVRANVSFSQHYAIYTWGSACYAGQCGPANKILQFNVAGVYYATSGIFFHQGVRNAWADPQKTTITDPYLRMFGWDGTVPGPTQGGLPIGCSNQSKDQVRMSAFSGYYVDSIKGGIRVEYGAGGFVQRFVSRMGNSSDDPFIVRIKDWNVTGPGTGYPAGVRVKKTVELNFFKGDPHDYPDTGAPLRFVRFVKVPSTYGDGAAYAPLTGCAYNNNFYDAPSNFARLENSTAGLNRDWDVTFEGDWNTNFLRGDLFVFSFDDSRSYRHTLRVADGTTITDTIRLNDTSLVTGSGSFTNLAVTPASGATVTRDNTITNTNIGGNVVIEAGTGSTSIKNVKFSGSARNILSVGTGATAVVTQLCAPAGSTVTGAGALFIDGVSTAMPYTVVSAYGCSLSGNPDPSPPMDVIVE